MKILPLLYNSAILIFSEIVIFMINWLQDFLLSNSVCNHTREEQIGLLSCGHLILLSLV